MTLPLLCEFFAEGKEKRLGEKEGYGTVGGGHVLDSLRIARQILKRGDTRGKTRELKGKRSVLGTVFSGGD